MPRRPPRTDDPNLVLIFMVRVAVNHDEKCNGAGDAQNVPSLLSILEAIEAIEAEEMKRIVPHQYGIPERDPVLEKVAPILFSIPLKLWHRPDAPARGVLNEM